MNYHIACERLQLDPYSIHDQKRIKKQYHLLALKFHPDKNKDENAHDHFLEIQEAYHFLMKTNHKPEIPPYEAFVRFFKGTLDEQTRDDYLHGALDKILSICEKQAIQIIDHVPYAKFQKIYNIVTKYKHIFALSPEFYKAMEKRAIFWFSQGSLKKRTGSPDIEDPETNPMNDFSTTNTSNRHTRQPSNASMSQDDIFTDYNFEMTESELDASFNETMILRPNLDDVIIDNVYKCHYTDVETTTKLSSPLYIPLWHHELTYDRKNNTDLTIKILPKLPSSNYWIDDDNNLHQRIEYTLSELWDCAVEERCLEIYFAKKRFLFYPHEIKINSYQTWTWENEGISRINMNNIYDVSKRADVVLHIHITGLI